MILLLTWLIFILVTATLLIPAMRKAATSAALSFDDFVASPRATFIVVFITALFIGALPTLLGHRATPAIHDEFANLLVADTLLNGRLTNPSPPFPEHFATVHELMQPSYASKFPPGTGIALAFGQFLGLPIIGAFTTIALASAVIALALRYWVPARWAVLGGVLSSSNTLVFSWGQNFWGGEVAMLGGALLILGYCRATRFRHDIPSGLAIGSGLAIFALSRPFEGAITALLLAAITIVQTARARHLRSLMLHTAPATFAILIPAMLWIGYYNWRVTGHALRMPWNEYAQQQMTVPTFFGKSIPTPPHFVDTKLRSFHEQHEREEYDRMVSLGYIGRLREIVDELSRLALDQDVHWFDTHHGIPTPMVLIVPLLIFACFTSSAGRLGTLLVVGLILIHPALTPWTRPHYYAAALAALMLAITIGLHDVARLAPNSFASAPVAGLFAAQCAITAGAVIYYLTPSRFEGQPELLKRLEADPTRKIVLVHYIGADQQMYEWVYNRADLNSAKVIFARSINLDSDRKLLDHFKDREPWMLDVNSEGARISVGRPSGT